MHQAAARTALEKQYEGKNVPKIVLISLCGSQNYEIDTEKSDVDSKVYILPTVEDIALLRKPLSQSVRLENDDQCEIKDIRLLPELLRKQSLNFLEVLFTKYYIIEEAFAPYFERLISKREEIARYHPFKCVCSMYGQMKLNWMKIKKSDEEKVINKALVFIWRGDDFISNYLQNNSFEKCFVPNAKLLYRLVKEGLISNVKDIKEEILVSTDKVLNKVGDIITEMSNSSPNKEIDLFLDSFIVDVVEFGLLYKD